LNEHYNYSIKAAIIISFSTILILSTPGFTSSQTMLPALESPSPSPGGNLQMPSEGEMPKLIQGKYVNSEFGFEITFPEGIQGTNTSMPESTIVNVVIPGIPSSPLPSSMIIIMKDSSKKNNSMPSSDSSLTDSCPPLSMETATLGGKVAKATITPCNMEAASMSKTRNYNIDLGGGKTISIVFVSNPTTFDTALPKFEEIVKTVKFTK
jgi:hypothetical protein